MKPAKLVEIVDQRFAGGPKLFTTLEGENPGGSIKDHMVLGGLRALLETGRLGPGMRVTEASAGSTALSLAHYSAELGVSCALFVPDSMDPSKLERLRKLGAEVHALPPETGFELFAEYCKRPGVVPFDQMRNTGHRAHYHELGRRISSELGRVGAVIGAVGTGHSLVGVAEAITPKPRIVTAEPVGFESPGVRNIVATRHGGDDPCVPELFDQRIALTQEELFPDTEVRTSMGFIRFSESFRLVLTAATRIQLKGTADTVFLVGAASTFAGRPPKS